MSGAFVILNIAYLVYAISPIFKEILRLRVTLLAATILYMLFGLADWTDTDSRAVFFWNIPVLVIHAWQIWVIVADRRNVALDAEAEAVRTLMYPDLDRVSFNKLWQSSYERALVPGEVFIHEGESVDLLYLVMDGDVEANVSNQKIVHLGRLRFVGEISSFTGTTASATVSATTDVRVRVWSKAAHTALCAENPDIERAHLRALGNDLSRKLI